MTLFARIARSFVLLWAIAPAAFAQTAAEPKKPEPTPGPRIATAPSGVIVISGSSRKPAPPEDETAEKNPEKANEADRKTGAGKPVEPGAPKPPSERSAETTYYDPSGNRVASPTAIIERNSESSSRGLQTFRDINGGEVPYLASTKETVSQSPGRKVSEQTVQRYDRGGNPTSKQVVREEVRALAGGTVETTRTVLEEDLNGRLRPAERVVSRQTISGNRTSSVTTAEKPSINGEFRPYMREESVETKTSESSAQVDVVRKLDDGAGTLVETEREQTMMTESGGTARTESTVWKRDYATAKMEFRGKAIGKRTERSDGSADESVEIYGFSIDDGPVNANTSSPQLQRTIEKQIRVGAEGEKVETSTIRTRGIADHRALGSERRVRKVTKPGAGGETIETQVYERGVNGNMVPTEVIVEKTKN